MVLIVVAAKVVLTLVQYFIILSHAFVLHHETTGWERLESASAIGDFIGIDGLTVYGLCTKKYKKNTGRGIDALNDTLPPNLSEDRKSEPKVV